MKKLTTIAISLLLLPVVMYGLVGNYFYNYALNANAEKEFLEDNPHLQESEAVLAGVAEEARIADNEFKQRIAPSSLEIKSTDKKNLQLHSYFYENEADSNKWAIVAHGYTSSADSMTRWVRHFHEEDYHVLAPDLRGHGESEGDYIGMGWHDRLDILSWIDEIIERDPQAEIVLFGISMGASAVLMTSGEELPDNIKVIVADCGYTSVSDVFIYQLDDLFGLPEFPVMQAANTVTKIRAGYDIYEASALDQVKHSQIPILFIHGEQDSFVPYEMLDELYEATPVEKDKLVIHGAEHGDAEKVDPTLYWSTVWHFIDAYIE